MAVPEATMVSSITCMLGAPPVPRMSRDANLGAGDDERISASSTSLDRGEDFDRLSVGQARTLSQVPRGTTVAVDGGRATRGSRRVLPNHQLGERHAFGKRLRAFR